MNENYPKAYKEGVKDFYGRDFVVSPNVLIPRPETEMMVDTVLNLAGKAYLPGVKPKPRVLPKDLRILDVGTGSGCIAITLALELPEAKVTACDISKKALAVAKENAKKFDAKVKFVQSNLLDNVDGDFDIVVANLPYVDNEWEWLDYEALSHEPRIALFAKNHGLELVYKLIEQVAERKIKHLVLEADPCQHEQIVNFADKKGLKLVETRGFALYLSE